MRFREGGPSRLEAAVLGLAATLLLAACEEAGDGGPGWTEPRSVVASDDAAEVQGASVGDLAIDAEGAPAIAFYRTFRVRVSRFDYEADDWAPATSPNSFERTYFNPRIAFDTDNDAVVVYEANTETPSGLDIQGAFYDATTGWDLDYVVSDGSLPGDTYNPEIAMNDAGEGFVVYRESVVDDGVDFGRRQDVVVIRYDPTAEPGEAWVDRTTLTSPAPEERVGYGPSSPRIAMDASGNAVVTWNEAFESGIEGVSGYERLHAALYDAATETWGDAEIIDNDVDLRTAQYHWVEMTTDGHAIAVWTERPESSFDLATFAAVHSGAGWGDPVLLDDGDGDSNSAPYVKVDGAGNAMALWRHGPPLENVWWSSFYDGTTGLWQPAEPIATLPGGAGNALGATGYVGADLAFDADGNALVVWSNRKAPDAMHPEESDAWSVRWNAMTRTWEEPILMEELDAVGDETVRTVYNPEVEFDGEGNAIAVWSQRSGAPDGVPRLMYSWFR